MVDNARRAYGRLTLAPLPVEGRLEVVDTPQAAAAGADLVQESAPERLELKQELLAAVEAALEPDAIVGSSTSGLLPTAIAAGLSAARAARAWPTPSTPSTCCRWWRSCPASGRRRRRRRARRSCTAAIGMEPLRAAPRARRLRRRPAAGGDVARGAVARARRRRDGRARSTTPSASGPVCASRSWARSSPTGSRAARPACGTSWRSSGRRCSGRGRG